MTALQVDPVSHRTYPSAPSDTPDAGVPLSGTPASAQATTNADVQAIARQGADSLRTLASQGTPQQRAAQGETATAASVQGAGTPAATRQVRLIPSVVAPPGSVRVGQGYGEIEGGSVSLEGRPGTGDGAMNSTYKPYPGMGVITLVPDAKGKLQPVYGVFTDKKDAKGNYILREATPDERLGMQAKAQVDAQGWKKELMIAGAWYYASGVLEGAIALRPMRRPPAGAQPSPLPAGNKPPASGGGAPPATTPGGPAPGGAAPRPTPEAATPTSRPPEHSGATRGGPEGSSRGQAGPATRQGSPEAQPSPNPLGNKPQASGGGPSAAAPGAPRPNGTATRPAPEAAPPSRPPENSGAAKGGPEGPSRGQSGQPSAAAPVAGPAIEGKPFLPTAPVKVSDAHSVRTIGPDTRFGAGGRHAQKTIARGDVDLKKDIEAINGGRGFLLPDGQIRAPSGRLYGTHPGSRTIYPTSGPGLVGLSQVEFRVYQRMLDNGGLKGTALREFEGHMKAGNPGLSAESRQKLIDLYNSRGQ